MFYSAYQAQSDLFQPISALARSALAGYRFWSDLSWTGLAETCVWRNIAASWEMLGRVGLDHERPAFGIESTLLAGRRVAVSEEKILYALRQVEGGKKIGEVFLTPGLPSQGMFAGERRAHR